MEGHLIKIVTINLFPETKPVLLSFETQDSADKESESKSSFLSKLKFGKRKLENPFFEGTNFNFLVR